MHVLDNRWSRAGYRLHPLAKCFSAPRQAKSGEPGWEEQPSVMNYSWLLRTTPLPAKEGMDDAVDGRMKTDEEQMKEGLRLGRGVWRREKGMSSHFGKIILVLSRSSTETSSSSSISLNLSSLTCYQKSARTLCNYPSWKRKKKTTKKKKPTKAVFYFNFCLLTRTRRPESKRQAGEDDWK